MGNDRKIGILKLINYQVADESNFQKGVDYILRPDSTNRKLIGSRYLEIDRPLEGLRIINDRWTPKGSRLFKHGVFSFGVPNLSPNLAFDVTREILNYYDSYPIIYSVHTNISRRIHAHFLMGMVNVKTGKKFEQSPSSLRDFQMHYNKIAIANKLPPLKGFDERLDYASSNEAVIPSRKGITFETEPECDYYLGNEMGYIQPMLPTTLGRNPIGDVNMLVNDFQKNMYQWYLLGRDGR